MYHLKEINDFLDANLGVLVTVPELDNKQVYILKEGIDKKYYKSYRNYFMILKWNVLLDIWQETPVNAILYQNILEAGILGDQVEFLRLMEEMKKQNTA